MFQEESLRNIERQECLSLIFSKSMVLVVVRHGEKVDGIVDVKECSASRSKVKQS